MSKATNKGTCQVCGCIQKLPGGRLAKHGYTTRWGFFAGVCTGSGATPFEQSKHLIDGAIASAQNKAVGILEFQGKLREPVEAGTSKVWINAYFPAKRRGEVSHYRWMETGAYAKDRAPIEGHAIRQGFYYEKCGSAAFDMGEFNRQIGNYEDATLEAAITTANSRYAEALNKDIEQIATYVKWQKERIKDWAPKPLLPL